MSDRALIISALCSVVINCNDHIKPLSTPAAKAKIESYNYRANKCLELIEKVLTEEKK